MAVIAEECPSGGFIRMVFAPEGGRASPNAADEFVTRKLACRRYTCPHCKNINLMRFRGLVKNGVSILGRCWFITLTYRRTSTIVDAAYVRETWARFWSKMQSKSPRWKEAVWLKVVELTQRKQPHLHLIVRLGGSDDEGPPFSRVGGLELARDFRDEWHWASGGSFVVDAREVWGPSEAASYLAKYFSKFFEKRKELEAAGFSRRYSRSWSWPKIDYNLKGMEDGHRYVANYYLPAYAAPAEAELEASHEDPRAELGSSTLGLELVREGSEQKSMKKVRKVLVDA